VHILFDNESGGSGALVSPTFVHHSLRGFDG
jgi:hypothetical protein